MAIFGRADCDVIAVSELGAAIETKLPGTLSGSGTEILRLTSGSPSLTSTIRVRIKPSVLPATADHTVSAYMRQSGGGSSGGNGALMARIQSFDPSPRTSYRVSFDNIDRTAILYRFVNEVRTILQTITTGVDYGLPFEGRITVVGNVIKVEYRPVTNPSFATVMIVTDPSPIVGPGSGGFELNARVGGFSDIDDWKIGSAA